MVEETSVQVVAEDALPSVRGVEGLSPVHQCVHGRPQGDALARQPVLDTAGSVVLADEENPDVFYLNEVYADVDAFNAHATGPYFAAFFAEAGAYAEGPTWLMRGNLVGDKAAA
ncbi:antibiotic biosynthesis monooxygenase [Streptomyces sp. NBC_00038]|uniref:putative quinol monooxygenase n=1 Tax=Streptomyces sp. NBC_00038 TaxID=2903615 RepID=UPI002B1DE585|nr:antibiotic biosynthesis monooxygenase [Streptomyces sp. NBC_00038]